MPSDMILEGLYMSKLQNCVQLQTVLALYDQETARNKEPKLFTIKDNCKTSHWSGDENSKLQTGTMLWKGDQSPRVKKERKPALKGNWECFQWKAHGQCSKGDSYSFNHVAKVRDKKDDRLLLHPIRRQNGLTARDKNSHRDLAVKRKALWTSVKFHADSNSAKIRHENSGTLLCVWITCPKKDVYIATNVVSDMLRNTWSPAKSQGKVVQRVSCDIEGVYTIIREHLVYVNKTDWDRNTPSNSPRAPGTKSKFGKERVHREVYPKMCASWA